MPDLSENQEVRRAQCGQCGGWRNCGVRGYFKQQESDEDWDWWAHWRILQCLGCNYTFVEKISGDSSNYSYAESIDGKEEIVYDEVKAYWPALAKRPRPEWMSLFGIDAPNVGRLDEAMQELYGALDNDLIVLAGIGIRTCFDVASEALGVDPNETFANKIGDLVTRGHIGAKDKDRIGTLIDAGSASAHRGWKPSIKTLNIMTEILEHFVYDAFVAPHRRAELDAKAGEMKKTVPPRVKAAKKANST